MRDYALAPVLRNAGVRVLRAWRAIPTLVPQEVPPRFAHVDAATMRISNVMFQSREFRKMHLELASCADGLNVLHCVMFPRAEFDIPILSMDMVSRGDRVTFAIADPCPVGPMCAEYVSLVRRTQTRLGVSGIGVDVPEWGRAIFSPMCVTSRPRDAAATARFVDYCIGLTEDHVRWSCATTPSRGSGERRKAQTRYCAHQLRNDKTLHVLRRALGPEDAEAYMRDVMFDG